MKKPGAAALSRARAAYAAGEVPLTKIAASLGLSPAAFRALRRRENWPPRAAPAAEAPEEQLDTQALERRLVRALRREIARAESEIENAAQPGAERKARILGLLVKTLGDLRRLGAPEKDSKRKAADDVDDESPGELAAWRAALAQRLERLRPGGPAR